mmetsp:Transcript_29425/g.65909  ORF Transcript_29425/g.65909 Transcript_29425/m.65909 type:complete len:218 (+) Transcript_29425:132-785(+)
MPLNGKKRARVPAFVLAAACVSVASSFSVPPNTAGKAVIHGAPETPQQGSSWTRPARLRTNLNADVSFGFPGDSGNYGQFADGYGFRASSFWSPGSENDGPAPRTERDLSSSSPWGVRLTHPGASTSSREATDQAHGLLNPDVIGAIQTLEGVAEDPELADFFADFNTSGPLASMHHLGRPGVATRLSALMGQVVSAGGRHQATPSAKIGGWGRRKF